MKVLHWLKWELPPLQYIVHSEGVADYRLTECNAAYLSEELDKKRYTTDPKKVTCKNCLKSTNLWLLRLEE